MLLACGPLECITNCLSLKIMKEYRNINLLTVLLYAYYLRWMGSVFNVEIIPAYLYQFLTRVNCLHVWGSLNNGKGQIGH